MSWQPISRKTGDAIVTAADDFAVRVVWAEECVDLVNEINPSRCCH
jgi:hypothetical protein